VRVTTPAAPALELGEGSYELHFEGGSREDAPASVFALASREPLALEGSGARRRFEVVTPAIYVVELPSEGGVASVHVRRRLVVSPTLIFALVAAPVLTVPGVALLEASGRARTREITLGGSLFRQASVRRQLAAVVFDLVAVAVMMVLLLLLAPLFLPLAPLFPLAPVAYLWSGDARGRSLGQWLAGIRVVNASGGAPGWGAGLLRTLAWAAGWAALGGGYAIAALRGEGRAPHDALAGTQVVHD
jgi:hypothetical protein